jgi:hypothetical protein
MLELFQMTWPQITQKMPEIAEAGYNSLWLPNPAKGNSGGYSIGYDVFDPFDLGSTNQQGTVATRYGTMPISGLCRSDWLDGHALASFVMSGRHSLLKGSSGRRACLGTASGRVPSGPNV